MHFAFPVQVVLTAEVVVVSLDEAYRPRRLPVRVRELLQLGERHENGPLSWE